MKKNFILISLVCLILVGCNKRTTSTDSSVDVYASMDMVDSSLFTDDRVIHAQMRYYNFNQLDNLSAFFNELSIRHPLVLWHENFHVKEDALMCINKIDAYRNGESNYFPDSLVYHCINSMGFELAFVDDHGCDSIDLCFIDWFMMCAAFYSPDITCLVEKQSSNHNAGFNNVGRYYNSIPWWPYAFFKCDKGFEVVNLGDYNKVEKVFELCDDENRKYYLFSSNSSYFHQWLYWRNDHGEYIKVAEYKDTPDDCEGSDLFYFSPEKLLWKYSRIDNNGNLIALREEPALRLFLNGAHSRIE